MRQEVIKFIKRHDLIKKGSRVVVGVSGGPDSIALLHFLYHNRQKWDISVIACSIDHMLRGEESAEDLIYVSNFCDKLDIPFIGKQVDVKQYQKTHGVTVEVAARDCRYQFFQEVMDSYRADYLALAHHGDDQIETMLMRQVFGSFGLSKSGIPYKRPFASGFLIRPFLSITKDNINIYCKEEGLSPRIDATNSSTDITRNRFRQHLLPFLKEENPQVHLRFQQESEQLREDHLFIEALARGKLPSILLKKSDSKVILSVQKFKEQPLPLQRRLIHLILNYLYNVQEDIKPYNSIHIEDILILLQQRQSSGQLHLPNGLIVQLSYNQCVFTFTPQQNGYDPYEFKLELQGTVITPMGKILSRTSSHYPEETNRLQTFVCDLNLIQLPIIVRNRQDGDRISLKGMNGTKKVKDIFIDKKIRHDERQIWPIVTDASGEILWVPNLKMSSIGTCSSSTKLFLILSFVPNG